MTEPLDNLRNQLQRAGDIPPPAALWARVRDGQARMHRRRRIAAGVAASALALAVVAVVPWLAPSHDAHPPQTSLAMAGSDPAASMIAIDRALQAAYDRGASDMEIAPIWEARNVLATRLSVIQGSEISSDQGI